MCDNIIVMNRGEIEESGDPDKIFASPKKNIPKN